MHAFVTSKNVKWCHLIWPTLYIHPWLKHKVNRYVLSLRLGYTYLLTYLFDSTRDKGCLKRPSFFAQRMGSSKGIGGSIRAASGNCCHFLQGVAINMRRGGELTWSTTQLRWFFCERRRRTSPASKSDGTTSRSRKNSVNSLAISANEFYAAQQVSHSWEMLGYSPCIIASSWG